MKTRSTKQVLKAVGSDKLALYRGEGYWYFSYDDPAKGLYDTYSVLTMRLSDMSLERWVQEGRDFVTKMEQAK